MEEAQLHHQHQHQQVVVAHPPPPPPTTTTTSTTPPGTGSSTTTASSAVLDEESDRRSSFASSTITTTYTSGMSDNDYEEVDDDEDGDEEYESSSSSDGGDDESSFFVQSDEEEQEPDNMIGKNDDDDDDDDENRKKDNAIVENAANFLDLTRDFDPSTRPRWDRFLSRMRAFLHEELSFRSGLALHHTASSSSLCSGSGGVGSSNVGTGPGVTHQRGESSSVSTASGNSTVTLSNPPTTNTTITTMSFMEQLSRLGAPIKVMDGAAFYYCMCHEPADDGTSLVLMLRSYHPDPTSFTESWRREIGMIWTRSFRSGSADASLARYVEVHETFVDTDDWTSIDSITPAHWYLRKVFCPGRYVHWSNGFGRREFLPKSKVFQFLLEADPSEAQRRRLEGGGAGMFLSACRGWSVQRELSVEDWIGYRAEFRDILWSILRVRDKELNKSLPPANGNEDDSEVGRLKRRCFAPDDFVGLFSILTEDKFVRENLGDLVFVDQLLRRYSDDLTSTDVEGNTALHIVLSKSFESLEEKHYDRHCDMIRRFVHAGPASSRQCNVQGKLPLHIALENGLEWGDALSDLIDAAPEALETRDLVTRMYPFMAAAVAGDVSNFDAVFELLRKAPAVMSYCSKWKETMDEKVDSEVQNVKKLESSVSEPNKMKDSKVDEYDETGELADDEKNDAEDEAMDDDKSIDEKSHSNMSTNAKKNEDIPKKPDHENSVNEKPDHEKSDHEKSDNKKPDHEKSDDEKSDDEKSDHEKSDNEKSDHEEADHEKSDHEKLDHEESDHENLDHDESDHEKLDHKKNEMSDNQESDHEKSDHEMSEDEKSKGGESITGKRDVEKSDKCRMENGKIGVDESDDEKSDDERSDMEHSDVEKSDNEKSEDEKSNYEKSESEKSDNEQSNSEKSESEKSDNEVSDDDKSYNDKSDDNNKSDIDKSDEDKSYNDRFYDEKSDDDTSDDDKSDSDYEEPQIPQPQGRRKRKLRPRRTLTKQKQSPPVKKKKKVKQIEAKPPTTNNFFNGTKNRTLESSDSAALLNDSIVDSQDRLFFISYVAHGCPPSERRWYLVQVDLEGTARHPLSEDCVTTGMYYVTFFAKHVDDEKRRLKDDKCRWWPLWHAYTRNSSDGVIEYAHRVLFRPGMCPNPQKYITWSDVVNLDNADVTMVGPFDFGPNPSGKGKLRQFVKGETWISLAAACKVHGLDPPSLSKAVQKQTQRGGEATSQEAQVTLSLVSRAA